MKRESTPFVFISVLLGYTAMWATRQSPYLAPENLTLVLATLKAKLEARQRDPANLHEFPFLDAVLADKHALIHLLNCELLTIPEALQWNERKNGNKSPYGFCSRYDKPNPDDDFIDLSALVRNIAYSCVEHDRHLHHWKIQIHPLQNLKRRLWDKCCLCGKRGFKPGEAISDWNGTRRWHRDCDDSAKPSSA